MHNVTYICLQIHATSILTFFPSLDPSCLLSVCWSHVVLFWFWDGGRQLGFIDRLMYMRRHAPINVRYRIFAILTKCCVWCGNFLGDYCNYKMAGKVKWAKLTVRSAARPRRMLAGHLAGTSGALSSREGPSHFTLVSPHGFLGSSHSHLRHSWSPWSALCPGRAWWETYRCLRAVCSELSLTHIIFRWAIPFNTSRVEKEKVLCINFGVE